MGQISARLDDDILSLFQDLKLEYGLKHDKDVIQFLAEYYLDNEMKADKPATQKTVKPQKGDFYAKIDNRDADLISSWLDGMYDKHGYKEPQVLRYYAKLQQAIDAKNVHLLRLPKAVNKQLLAIGQPKVDHGEVESLNHYLSIILKKALVEPKQKKTNTWF